MKIGGITSSTRVLLKNDQNTENIFYVYIPVRLCYIKIFIINIYINIIGVNCKSKQNARIVKIFDSQKPKREARIPRVSERFL